MKLYHTYRITTARLQPPSLKYEKLVGAFDWVLDKRNIIDSVEKNDVDALPMPTKLNVSSFEDIKHHVIEPTMTNMSYNEFDILATVVNCSSPKYVASVEKRLQELIVMDMPKETLTFTIWEEAIIEDQGKKLLHQFTQYPVILARRVGASKYNGTSLTIKRDLQKRFTKELLIRTIIHLWKIFKQASVKNSFVFERRKHLSALLTQHQQNYIFNHVLKRALSISKKEPKENRK